MLLESELADQPWFRSNTRSNTICISTKFQGDAATSGLGAIPLGAYRGY